MNKLLPGIMMLAFATIAASALPAAAQSGATPKPKLSSSKMSTGSHPGTAKNVTRNPNKMSGSHKSGTGKTGSGTSGAGPGGSN